MDIEKELVAFLFSRVQIFEDFTEEDLQAAILDFGLRERRFGLTREQVQSSNLT